MVQRAESCTPAGALKSEFDIICDAFDEQKKKKRSRTPEKKYCRFSNPISIYEVRDCLTMEPCPIVVLQNMAHTSTYLSIVCQKPVGTEDIARCVEHNKRNVRGTNFCCRIADQHDCMLRGVANVREYKKVDHWDRMNTFSFLKQDPILEDPKEPTSMLFLESPDGHMRPISPCPSTSGSDNDSSRIVSYRGKSYVIQVRHDVKIKPVPVPYEKKTIIDPFVMQYKHGEDQILSGSDMDPFGVAYKEREQIEMCYAGKEKRAFDDHRRRLVRSLRAESGSILQFFAFPSDASILKMAKKISIDVEDRRSFDNYISVVLACIDTDNGGGVAGQAVIEAVVRATAEEPPSGNIIKKRVQFITSNITSLKRGIGRSSVDIDDVNHETMRQINRTQILNTIFNHFKSKAPFEELCDKLNVNTRTAGVKLEVRVGAAVLSLEDLLKEECMFVLDALGRRFMKSDTIKNIASLNVWERLRFSSLGLKIGIAITPTMRCFRRWHKQTGP